MTYIRGAMDGTAVIGLLDFFVKRAAVMRSLPLAVGDWRRFCRTEQHRPFTEKHPTIPISLPQNL